MVISTRLCNFTRCPLIYGFLTTKPIHSNRIVEGGVVPLAR